MRISEILIQKLTPDDDKFSNILTILLDHIQGPVLLMLKGF